VAIIISSSTYIETPIYSLSVWIYQMMWNCTSYLKSFSKIITGCLTLPGSNSPACCESAVMTPELWGEIFPLTEIINPKLQLLTAQTHFISTRNILRAMIAHSVQQMKSNILPARIFVTIPFLWPTQPNRYQILFPQE
jgi:hypothetical protein